MTDQLVIRADANSQIGTGHVMRCIALGQAWLDSGGSVLFLTRCRNLDLLKRLQDEGFSVVELDGESDLIPVNELQFEGSYRPWFVLDGYTFSIDDHHAIRAAGYRLLVVDDCNHLSAYACDALLNQNSNACEYDYALPVDSGVLKGPHYILLRREFRRVAFEVKESETSRNLLITMGGADPDNVSLKVIDALRPLMQEVDSVRLIVGPANAHAEILRDATASIEGLELVFSADMQACMQWADFCISAAGSTCWELLAMGVPFASIILAENQAKVGAYLDEYAGVPCMGSPDEMLTQNVVNYVRSFNPQRKAASLLELIDGRGASRVVEYLKGTKS